MNDNNQKLPFLQQVINQVRVRHYGRRTEETYIHWIKRFIYYHKKRHPKDMKIGQKDSGRFIYHLLYQKNTRMPIGNGNGNMCFRLPSAV
jgi:hypothetical protein